MKSAIQALIATALEAEFKAFHTALNGFPAPFFGVAPARGHSAAWHALHIMDWTRCVIQPGLPGVNPALTYSYLGFEEEEWAKAVAGPTLAHEEDSRGTILNAVQSVCQEALSVVREAPAERFQVDAMLTAIKKPRPVIESLMYHVRHTAYHRGQLALVLKELR